MASDAQDSHRKHRRASEDDDQAAEKSSKRHKHRHHHRHHRHRHGSKKKEDVTKVAAVDEIESPPPSNVPESSSGGNNLKPDEDVEEGEILEQEGLGGRDDGVVDAEPGEVEHVGVRDRSDKQNLVFNADEDDKSSKIVPNEAGLPRSSSAKPQDELVSRDGEEGHANGDSDYRFHKKEKIWHRESEFPSNGDKGKNYYDDEKLDGVSRELGNQKNSSSESSGDKYKNLVRSPSCDRRGDEMHRRSRSRSYDRVRERSRSHSNAEEEALSKRRRYHEREDEPMVRRHGSDNLVRNDGREHHSKYSGLDPRQDEERSMEREVDRIRRREKEQERSRDSDRRRDKERERSGERDLVKDRKRGMIRDDSRDRVVDRFRRREEQHRSRDLENRERYRGDENYRSRDRKREDENDRYRDRIKADRDKDTERVRDRDRITDRKWGRHEGIEDSYASQDRYKHSGQSRSDEKGDNQDRTRKTDQSSKNYSVEVNEDRIKRDEEQEDNEEVDPLQSAEQEEEDLNRIKEESLRRRQAILEKYRRQQLQKTNESPSEQQTESHLQKPFEQQPLAMGVQKGPADHLGQSASAAKSGAETKDGRSDADLRITVFSVPPQQNGTASRVTSRAAGLGEGTPKSERSDDIFRDDIFGESPVGVRRMGIEDGVRIERSGLHDNWDDAEGYYCHRFGELLDGRYEITAAHGKGVFSTVVRAKNLQVDNGEPEEVAIKIIRSNDTMYKSGMDELKILNKLADKDPEDKRHCVRFLSNFKYRNHLCLVFESLDMNLREVLKKFGRNIGLKLTGVRTYAQQLFLALKHLKLCGVLHCDIKPDNMLVNEAKNVLKLCDFGNAMFLKDREVTPYLVSRFYRAPEIILGLTYDHPLDIWSVGCCLYELYTGKVLFPGATNNEMLRLHMELKGPFPKKVLRKGQFTDRHFDQDLNFLATEEDPVTKRINRRVILNIRQRDIGSIITGSPGEDPKMLADFKDLLDKMFVLDPDKRLTVVQALNHPFIKPC